MTETFSFDSGIKEYAINGDENRVLKVNVTDVNFLPRLYDSFLKAQELVKNIGTYEPKDASIEALREGIDKISGIDKAIRSGFDEVFYPGAAETVFGQMNVLSFVGNGDTIYESFMNAFISKMEKEIKTNSEESEKKISKYRDAYNKQKENFRAYVGRAAK